MVVDPTQWSQEKKEAVLHLIRFLTHPILANTKPDRERAYELARTSGITVEELLDAYVHLVRKNS